MASAKQRAAARRNIKKAQAALRRGKRSRRSKPKRSYSRGRTRGMRAFHRRQNKAFLPEAGKWAHTYRILDVLTGWAQRAIKMHGFTRTAMDRAKRDLVGLAPDGTFDLMEAMPNAQATAVGLIRDKIRSKLGVYRGMAKGKLLSYGIAFSPEIIAAGVVSPLDDPWEWKDRATMADRGYGLNDGQFHLFNDWQKQSVALDVGLVVAQKVAEKTGVNRELSKLTDGLVKL